MDYKVIKIIDNKTIVINGGSENGIKNGDKFEIFDTGEQITDPFTNENLGTLDTIKEIVTADNVLPKMTICRAKEKSRNGIFSLHSDFSDLIGTYENNKILNIDKTEISGGLKNDLTIRIGDVARKKTSLDNEAP